MDSEKKTNWIIRIKTWKLRAKLIYSKIMFIVNKYPPFKYFFYTLTYFEYAERCKINLKKEEKRTPWLTKQEMLREIKERSWREVHEAIIAKAKNAVKRMEEMEKLKAKTILKLDQFTQFLLLNVKAEQMIAYSKKITEFAAIDDPQESYDRMCEYIDSVIEKHSKKTVAG